MLPVLLLSVLNRSIGIHCRVLRLTDTVSQSDLQACVSEVSADRAIDGVLVQLPLPHHLDEEAVMEALDPRKDVDGFHPLNMG
jgi:5,10-methylene-tetrahydrofolate dehydrogenase/methenyl tetrahydrofolate cyclohydrolase